MRAVRALVIETHKDISGIGIGIHPYHKTRAIFINAIWFLRSRFLFQAFFSFRASIKRISSEIKAL